MARGATEAEKSPAFAITGHRFSHPSLQGQAEAVKDALNALFADIADSPISSAGLQLNTMLSDGVDQFAARAALKQGWRVNAILPFGAALTCAAMASSAADSAAVKRDLFEDAQRTAEPGYRSANPTIASFVELARRARIVAHSERDEHYVRAWLDDASAFPRRHRSATLWRRV